MSRFRAYIVDDVQGWATHTVRLAISTDASTRRVSYLMSDGVWTTVDEGALPAGVIGIQVPREAVEALQEAIEVWQGSRSHSATEAAVLRETLTVERARVDAILARAEIAR